MAIAPGKTAYLFPGQGAQAVGMGKDLCEAVPAARAVFEEADRALGFSLSGLCFEGPAETLTQTVNTQPAILIVSIACLAAARSALERDGGRPAFMAGHSLGEYSALVAAEALSFTDAVRLVRERGRLMQMAGDQRPGAMAAILGMEEKALAEVCQECGVEMANLNAPDQIVISGTAEGIERALQLAPARGARRAIPLRVSAAFHSALMEPAVPGMRVALEGVAIAAPAVPVIVNVTAQPLGEAKAIRNELSHQIRRPVQWFRTVQYLKDQGVTRYVEIGPGRTLTGLVKRVHAEAETMNIGTLADVRALGGA